MPDSEHADEGRHEEKRSTYLYRVMAEADVGTPRAELFRGLATGAENQAGIWAQHAGAALRDGLRMLFIGAAAGALTYAIGKLPGVSLT